MESDVRLRQTEKNDVFHKVVGAGLDAADFLWTDANQTEISGNNMAQFTISVLRHKPTDYFIRFGRYRFRFSPGDGQRFSEIWHSDSPTEKHRICNIWISELRKEANAPDLWVLAQQGRALSDAASSDTENLPFTTAEQSDITSKLEEVKQLLLATRQFQEREFGMIEGQFRYLDQSSKRLGRKDWYNIAFSVLSSLVIAVGLPPEQANHIIQTASALFSSLVHGVQRLLNRA